MYFSNVLGVNLVSEEDNDIKTIFFGSMGDLVFIIMRSRSTACIFGGGTLIASQDTYAKVVVYLSHLMNPSYKCSLNILYIFGIKTPIHTADNNTVCRTPKPGSTCPTCHHLAVDHS